MNEMKKCSRCGETKTLSEFGKGDNKDGLKSACKVCRKEEAKKYCDTHRAQIKEYYEKTKESKREYHREYNRKWYAENKEKKMQQNRAWRLANPEKVKEKGRRATRKIRSTLKGNLNSRISAGITHSLKNSSKGGHHWETLVGFTVNQLRDHLEKRFTPGMSWERFMAGEIHIDHKIPIAAFNFETPKDLDFKRCWSLKNLQPLWSVENQIKHAKLQRPYQPSLTI